MTTRPIALFALFACFALFVAFAPSRVRGAEDEAQRMSIDEGLTPYVAAEEEPEPRPLFSMPQLDPVMEDAFWGMFDAWVPWLPSPRESRAARLAVVAMLAFASFGLGRLRARLPRAGLLPRASALAHFIARVGVFVCVLVLASQLVPSEMMPAVVVILVAMAAAVGWSLRDFFPDVIAGGVLLFEARVKPGVWLSGEGFSGFVERVGLRATWLRDVYGHHEAIPNAKVITGALVIESTRDAMHEVRLRVPALDAAAETRAAVYDAALASPWVHATPTPVVLRDPHDETAWVVRARLLHQKHAARFEGELLERAEEMLAARRAARERDDEPAG